MIPSADVCHLPQKERLFLNPHSHGFFFHGLLQFSHADQDKSSIRIRLCDLRENIQQTTVIFLNIEPAYMADHKAIVQMMQLSQAVTPFLSERESRYVDGVTQDESGRIPP